MSVSPPAVPTVTSRDRGRQTRDAIVRALTGRDYPPTERELAQACGVSPQTVNKQLSRLRAEGRIAWDPPRKRTARIAPTEQRTA